MKLWLPSFVLFSAFLLTGCGAPAGPETVAVSGKITMKGELVADAVVVFSPKNVTTDSQVAAQGVTDAEGKYQLQTYVSGTDYKDGIRPGEYSVTVTKLEVKQDMRSKPKSLLPKKYALPTTTDLSATVAATATQFNFDLK